MSVPPSAQALQRKRRSLIGSSVATTLLLTVAVVGLIAVLFSPDRQHWSDDSRVLETQGTVLEEVSGSGSCKGGPAFETQVEWMQGDQAHSGWASTCRSGPDVGDRVDVWVRDDGEITLTAPAAIGVFIVLGIVFFLGMAVLCFFTFRSRFRALTPQPPKPPSVEV